MAAGVERARRAALGDALESLRAAEARHAALLSSHADELRRGLDALQRCAEEAARACASSGPPLPFLHRFRELSDAIERLSSKPLPEGADVDVEAWEREAEAVAAPPDRDAAVLLKLLAVKDHLIWALVEERDGLRAALAEQRAEEGRGGGGDDSR